jgi:hypothetical protein
MRSRVLMLSSLPLEDSDVADDVVAVEEKRADEDGDHRGILDDTDDIDDDGVYAAAHRLAKSSSTVAACKIRGSTILACSEGEW